MLTHIVIFTWQSEVTPAQVTAFAQALTTMADELADLVTIRHGHDCHFREGNGDYALVGSFANRAAWDAYQSHPAHKAFVRDFVTPLQASRLTIQF